MKSFEIKIEEKGNKLRGYIWERSKGVTSWVKFGDRSLRHLLVGLGDCEKISCKQEWFMRWEEDGRFYKLERCSNNASSFIRCSVRDLGAKWFCLCLPEEKGFLRGWPMMTEKLRKLGVSVKVSLEKNLTENKEPFVLVKKKTTVKPKSFTKAVLGIKHKEFDDVVRVKVGGEEIRERKTKLECCLVGRCRGGSPMQYTKTLKGRTWSAWELKGSLNVIILGKGMWLIEFDSKKEVDMILREGSRNLGNFSFSLEKWSEEVGCMMGTEEEAEAWVRIIGLPVHLWSRSILRKIDDSCRGFLAVDEDTTFMENLCWARIRVMWDGKSYPQFVEASVGPKRYETQLW